MEQTNLLNEFDQTSFEPATTGQRLANYIIDIIVAYLVILLLLVPLGITMKVDTDSTSFLGIYYLIFFGVFFAYYTLLEGSKGKTIGKMITKTKVLTVSGEKITYGKAFMRTLCRIVPFEFISAFLGTSMWHDKWVDTIVVKDK
jgi:uncharacterized RDD family membrane protein YckC